MRDAREPGIVSSIVVDEDVLVAGVSGLAQLVLGSK